MISALIDTSVWIEFFRKRSGPPPDIIISLENIIANDEAVIIEPIRAELLSGHIKPSLKNEIIRLLDNLDMIDLDWTSRTIWNDIIGLADIARNHGIPIPGIVDRMILLSALHANVPIASLDLGLLKLANKTNIPSWM